MEIQPEEEYECSICLDVLKGNLIKLSRCQHQFHKFCITQWYQKSNSCPLCRGLINDTFIIHFKPKFRKFFNRKFKLVADLKVNKIVFYKIEHDNMLVNSITYNREQDIEDDTEVNNMFEIDNGKIIGSPFFSILYSDMSLISVSNNFIIFNKLYLPKLTKNNKNTLALRHTKKNLKIQFDTKMDTLNCFEVLKKRNEYFRMIHY